jgi:uncharacterized membrane protein
MSPGSSYRAAGYALGFGMGGFFDGILLHQVLQWHHLLAGLDGARFQDLRVQILGDGLFHVLMYLITAGGLWLLWRGRGALTAAGAGRQLLGCALIGFGAWHVADGVLSHWLLGIHRIRMDTDIPLFWDLLWFSVFGIAFIVAGWLLRRRGGASGTGNSGRAPAAALVLLAIASGAVAGRPASDSPAVLVVFGPGTTPGQAMQAVTSVSGRLLWTDSSDQVWAIDLPHDAPTSELYRRGALFVSRSWLPAGCVNWLRA